MIFRNVVGGRKITCPSRSTLRKWADMTDHNEHEEVRILMAKYFRDYPRVEAFTRIRDYVRDKESWAVDRRNVYNLMHLSLDVTAGMLRNIELDFGEEVADKVRRCL